MLKWICLYCIVCCWFSCRQSYEPPEIKAPNRYLVVDGVINTKPDSKTTLQLSRTKNIIDTFLVSPETGAQAMIEAASGSIYALNEQAPGFYSVDHLSLAPAGTYRIRIRTSDGSEYLSDMVTPKQTPAIDSLSWKQDGDLTIYVSAHDPSGKARYYRWDYTETWQYHAFLETNYGLGVANGHIYYLDQATQIYNCWSTQNSTDIIMSNSVRLSDDVIDHFPVAVIPQYSPKPDIRYSTLVRQYALTEDAYKYWDILRKNSQAMGTLFDAQPGQLEGNLHNLSHPSEPVLGYVSACNVEEKRLFIAHLELFNWTSPVPPHACQEGAISQVPNNPFIWNYPDTSFSPWYFLSPAGIKIAKTDCLDCRRRGGTNQKPSFW
ncbi:MAG: DUF4249 domain-containing protein [Flavisolibacter sp.]